ncbi:hypothetical protein AJ78_06904 [Emergomyces pasteurianus Ep9510]|uniref:Uncharacterized protein n=1 Tax=Emergomyces pasteurianus Ep9510 TaxID=1447872 RepID=A0A1J9QBH7_9EURO|nr:hypothetical protein AJ78_06904 [Emergomyces pasteurianus Ep9510]
MPAVLINATFERVHTQSNDAFLNFFILYIHEHLERNTVKPDISLALAYLDGFSSFYAEQRVSILRQSCLIRDHHRCVVFRRFDRKEAQRRENKMGLRKLLIYFLIHLNPMTSENTELSDSKKNAIQILTMFEADITHLIERQDIDSSSRTIDPPSSRLLKSSPGAGDYIENILRDMENENANVDEDGSTNLGPLLILRLGGWLRTLAVT